MEPSQFSPLGDVTSVEKTEHGVLIGIGDERFRADVVRPDLLRLKISQDGAFDESPSFATSFQLPEAPPFRVVEGDAEIVLETDRIRLVISRSPFALEAYRSDGSIIFQDH